MLLECLVNPPGESGEVSSEGADDDSAVLWVNAVQADEVLPVEGQEDAALHGGERENSFVWGSLSSLVGLERRQHVMVEVA